MIDLNEIVERNVAVGTRVWVLRSQVRLALGQRELAISDRQFAMAVTPIDAEDWTTLGLLQIANKPDDSLRCFERAIEIDLTNFAAMQNSVHVLSERLNRTVDAVNLLTTMAELRPNNVGIIATRGILAARCGKSSLAIADANLAVLLNPGPTELLQIAGIYAILSVDSSAIPVTDAILQGDRMAHQQLSFKWLNKALLSDPKLAIVAASDADLMNVKNDPRFQVAIENALKLVSPTQ